jgi:group I intron endonuclease
LNKKIYNTGIYKITNIVTKDFYIGKAKNLSRRKTQHFGDLRRGVHHNIHLQRAFDKYGESSFVFEIALYCEDFELHYYEQKFVDILKPSYNIDLECVDSKKGYKTSDATKAKISVGNKGKVRSEETRKLMSIATSGENNPNYGKECSEEQKKAVSKAHLGKKDSDETRQRKSKARMGDKNPNFGKEMSIDQRQKISKSKTGQKRSPEAIEKGRQARIGTHQTQATKDKISLANKGKKREKLTGENNPMSNTNRKRREEEKKLSNGA